MLADPFLNLFLALLAYVFLLWFARSFNIGRKQICENCNNCCPDCKSGLNRIQRLRGDKIILYLTFKVFDLKRYMCNTCGWEGLRWEDKYRPNS